MQTVLKHVLRAHKWVCSKMSCPPCSIKPITLTKSGLMKLFPHNFGEPHNRTANPPGLNQHASAIDVCCPHKGSGDTIKSALVTHQNRWKWTEGHDIISSEKKVFWWFVLLRLWTMVRRLCIPRRFRYYEKSPATRVWAAEHLCWSWLLNYGGFMLCPRTCCVRTQKSQSWFWPGFHLKVYHKHGQKFVWTLQLVLSSDNWVLVE